MPGLEMPVIGLGVGAYGLPNGQNGEYWDDDVAEAAVLKWLSVGGRRLDTSLKYYNDIVGVGRALSKTDVARSEIFITSKVDDPFGFNETLGHFAQILSSLNTSYVDLLLIHWPGPIAYNFTAGSAITCPDGDGQTCGFGAGCRQDTWRALEQIFNAGQARAIGVSNFEQRHLEDILSLGGLVPAVNQIEFHPYWQSVELANYCKSLNITVNTYAPLGAPDLISWFPDRWPLTVLQQPAIQAVAQRHGKSAAQVMIRWHLQQGFVLNPRTWNVTHMVENLSVFDFELSSNDMRAISNVPRPLRPKICPDPILVP